MGNRHCRHQWHVQTGGETISHAEPCAHGNRYYMDSVVLDYQAEELSTCCSQLFFSWRWHSAGRQNSNVRTRTKEIKTGTSCPSRIAKDKLKEHFILQQYSFAQVLVFHIFSFVLVSQDNVSLLRYYLMRCVSPCILLLERWKVKWAQRRPVQFYSLILMLLACPSKAPYIKVGSIFLIIAKCSLVKFVEMSFFNTSSFRAYHQLHFSWNHSWKRIWRPVSMRSESDHLLIRFPF